MVKKSKGAKATRILSRVRKDLKMKNGSRKKGMSRGNATIVLAQGAMAPPKRNFGTRKFAGRLYSGKSTAALVRCLDARVPRTLGLPRPVGPYTVIRTTVLHQTNSEFVLFCPFHETPIGTSGADKWLDWCGVEAVSGLSGITAGNNTRPIPMPLLHLGEACEVVPAAMTVQVMNPAALQAADGVFAMTRVNQQLMLGSSPAGLTYTEMGTRVISFYSPRLLTGGKLSLRGVKCSAYPLDMNEYSDFLPVKQQGGDLVSWHDGMRPAALSPILFIQRNAQPKVLEFMVTIEWRVRFDPGNPATASHTFHDCLADEAWNNIIKAAQSTGHGVFELAEGVAEGGEAAAEAVAAAV